MKERLDILLVERRLVESRMKAKWLIKNGYVLVDSRIIRKPSKKVENSHKISLKAPFPYVGRGGLKLEAALSEFSIIVRNKVCVDIGASIGGFTDCLLKHGATKVYAIDTAIDLLHPSLICNKEKVVALLGVDARNLTTLGELVDIMTVDVTFSSLKDLLPNIIKLVKLKGDIIVLVKPIFETNFYENQKFRIIKDTKILIEILKDLLNWSAENKLNPKAIIKSPILGKGGSIEFFVHFKIGKDNSNRNYEDIIRKIL
jgi:23S rRNA (cytidine1920-2'-O)/16S rRNA (cytidine1409-2'-O)-methyltransferase